MSDKDVYKAPFYDSNTVASNPGKMNVNFFQWIKMNFKKVAINTLMLLVAGYLTFKVHWLFGILLLLVILYNVWYWFSVISKFKAGDVNVGKVISVNPDRVAVATNMTKMFQDFPILKIIDTNLPKFEKQVGMFIPTVALYNDNPHGYPFWSEFHPVPISHGTTDKGILKNRYETFAPEDFETVNKYLAEINSQEPGTYKVEEETSGWKDFKDVEVGKLENMKAPKKEEKKGI